MITLKKLIKNLCVGGERGRERKREREIMNKHTHVLDKHSATECTFR